VKLRTNSKLFTFLLGVAAYLLFAFQWVFNYVAVWYANIPEETQHFSKGSNMGFYAGYAYVLILLFILYVVLGIFFLMKSQNPKIIRNILTGVLVISAFCAWHYGTFLHGKRGTAIINFITLALFAISIFKLHNKKVNTA
jgi:hypothetical protein